MNSLSTFERAEKITDALVYEGLTLSPTRPTNVQLSQLWKLGGLYPQAYRGVREGSDACYIQTECLVLGNPHTQLNLRLHFLHLVQHNLGEFTDDPSVEYRPVESLRVGDKVHYATHQVLKRVCDHTNLPLTLPVQSFAFSFPAFSTTETLQEPSGKTVGVVIRRHEALAGIIKIVTKCLEDDLYLVTVQVRNRTPLSAEPRTRADAVMNAFLATQTMLHLTGGEFISANDPPAEYRPMTMLCENIRTHPVLTGNPGDHDLMLSLPILLPDYPSMTPATSLPQETQVDQTLGLRPTPATRPQKFEVRYSDERASFNAEGTDSLSPQIFRRLHSATPSFTEKS